MHQAILLPRFKRIFLQLLLGLTGWTALLVAAAVYRGGRSPDNLGWALGTILSQGFLILMSFAAFTALDRKRLRYLAIAGMMLALLVLTLLPLLAWQQITDYIHLGPFAQLTRDPMTQLAATGVLTAGLACLIPFILLPQMRGVGRIVQWTTIVYMTGAYLAVILYLWHIDTDRVEESVTMLLVPAGACMMGVFVMHKFLEIRQADPLTSVAPELHVNCPRCGNGQTLGLGESRCCRCRLRFTIAVEEPRCPNCAFNLHRLTRPICPECGFQLDAADIPAAGHVHLQAVANAFDDVDASPSQARLH